MACANPWKLIDKNTHEFISKVPCGHCVNCIVDTRNTIDDLCNEEMYQKNYVGSYVTLTYDDFHLNWRNNWHGGIVPSLSKRDASNFVKRLRKYMYSHKIDTPLASRNFRYIVAGEYGSDRQRPHLHFVFFGLDNNVCQKMFRECWQYGNIKILPVKPGCFRYVADYLTKQLKAVSRPQDVYDCYNLERPFFHHSCGLGKTLFIRQWDFITKNDYCYKSRKGQLRPLPVYYMRRYNLIRADSTTPELEKRWRINFPNKSFSLKKYNIFKSHLARVRQDNLVSKLRNEGDIVPFDVPPDWHKMHWRNTEAVISARDYIRQIKVKNSDVVDCSAISDFIGDNGEFKFNHRYPSYRSYRQVAYDIQTYGDLLPF